MRVLSLFSGVGGFDMGLEAAGMTTVFQCEIDKKCQEVLTHHWPDVPKWDDVSTLTGAHVLNMTGGVDVVAWGSPCQDLSVAGKRAGLGGERSGLFHQGIRIIKEMRELSNGQYPTWSLWENVAGALSSNSGADFGQVLYEMDEAGACFSEWALLDAQHFGVPQRRRRIFVASCFDSATSARCPEPLFPVSESVPRNPATGTASRQDVAAEVADSVGGGGELGSGADIANTIGASLYHKSTVVNQDVNNGHVVVQEPVGYTAPSFAKYVEGVGTLRADGGDLGGGSETIVVEPMLIDGRRVDDVRVYTEPVQTLQERMGTGGNNVPVVAQEPILAFDTKFGSNANVFENASPPLKSSQQSPSIAYEPIAFSVKDYGGDAGFVAPTLKAGNNHHSNLGGGNPPAIVYEPTDVNGSPIAATLRGFGHGWQGQHNTTNAVAQDHDVEAISYDGYNQKVWEEIHVPLRTEGDAGDFVARVNEPTLVVRRLTPLECERLMGWPDNHTAQGINGPITDTNRYKMCGNGVASPVATWLGQHLMATR